MITWTATAALPAGNIIQVNIDNTNNAASTNNGTANFGFFTGESSAEFNLAVSGDQIFAWQAPNNDRPTTANFSPIAAINGASTGWVGLISSGQRPGLQYIRSPLQPD